MFSHKYHSFDDLLQSQWLYLEDNSNHSVFQSFHWCSHWYSSIGSKLPNISLHIIVIYSEDVPVSLFPFIIRRVGPIRLLEFLGDHLSDYNSPLIHSHYIHPHSFLPIWNYVLDVLPHFDIFNLVRIPEYLGADKNPFVFATHSLFSMSAFSANLPPEWSTYSLNISSKLLKENARNTRRLLELGKLNFLLASTQDQADFILQNLFEQKQRRYNETGARNILSDSKVRNFYSQFFTKNSTEFQVHISAMCVDDVVLSAHFGFIYRNCFYYIMPAFASLQWARYSPGRMLLQYLLCSSIEDSLSTFDFTTGSELYKDIWCDTELRLFSNVQALSFLGKLYSLYLKFVLYIKRTPFLRTCIMRLNARLFRFVAQMKP